MTNEDAGRGYEVVVDQDICMAAGLCYGTYPELFTAGPLGVAELTGGGRVEISSVEMVNAAREASLACPSGAITVVEADAEKR